MSHGLKELITQPDLRNNCLRKDCFWKYCKDHFLRQNGTNLIPMSCKSLQKVLPADLKSWMKGRNWQRKSGIWPLTRALNCVREQLCERGLLWGFITSAFIIELRVRDVSGNYHPVQASFGSGIASLPVTRLMQILSLLRRGLRTTDGSSLRTCTDYSGSFTRWNWF